MKPIILKTIYCKKNQKSKAARILAYILLAVGMNRVFSKNDLIELLIRFQLMYPDSNLPLNYFNASFLFTYSVDDITEYYTLNDLKDNLGLEISESVYRISSDGFLSNIHSRRGNAILSGILNYGCVLKPLPIEYPYYTKDALRKQVNDFVGLDQDDQVKVINRKQEGDLVGIINEKRVADVVKLAELIANSIEDEEYEELEKRVALRKAEIDNELAKIPLAKFNLNNVPLEVKQKIYQQVASKFGMQDKAGNPDEQAIEEGDDLMYLIWLWSNGFVEEGELSWVSEHFDFDYDKSVFQDSEGAGPQLNYVREYLEIDQFFPDFKIKEARKDILKE